MDLSFFWNAVCIVRGIFVAEIYWDWKALISNAMALMLPVVIFFQLLTRWWYSRCSLFI